MPAPREDADARVRALRGGDPPAAARAVLNAVVGSRAAKRAYVAAGAAPALVAALPAAPAVAALGSLACNYEPGAAAVADAAAAPRLVAALFSDRLPVVQAAARALKVLLASPSAGARARAAVMAPGAAPARVVALMGDRSSHLAETCAAILAHVCVGPPSAAAVRRAGAVPALVALLRQTAHAPSTEAALGALAALVAGDPALARDLVEEHDVVALALPLVRARPPVLRMRAARLLTNLHCAARGAVDARSAAREDDFVFAGSALATCGGDMDAAILAGVDGDGGGAAALHRRALSTLVVELVRLLRPESPLRVRLDAPRVITMLVEGSPRLQQLACEAGVMDQLSKYLNVGAASSLLAARPESSPPARPLPRAKPPPSAVGGAERRETAARAGAPQICPDGGPECGLVASALECFAAVCALWDAGREACIRGRVLPSVVLALNHPHVDVVSAAVKCVRSLSRSVKIVRRELVFVNIAVPLLRLLAFDSLEVKRQASACICNVAVEFSPLKETVLTDGGVPVLVGMLQSGDTTLRLNSLWALQNMMFKAKPGARVSLMDHIGFDALVALCRDEHRGIRARALMLLRNLICCVFDVADADESDMYALMQQLGDQVLVVLTESLQPRSPTPIAVEALYVVANISSGPEALKVRILESQLAPLLLHWIEHRDERVRVAALWCVINLGWKDSGHAARARRLNSDSVRYIVRGRRRVRSPPAAGGEDEDWRRVPREDEGREGVEVGAEVEVEVEEPQDDDDDDDEAGEEEGDGEGDDRGSPMEAVSATERGRRDGEALGAAELHRPDGFASKAPPLSGHEWRLQQLRALGFERTCQHLVSNDKHVDVVGRARRVLDLFETRAASGARANVPLSLRERLGRLNPSPPSPSSPSGGVFH